MSASRTMRVALFLGIATTAPAVAWLLPQITHGDTHAAGLVSTALYATWIADAMAMALLGASAAPTSTAAAVSALLMLGAVPLPLAALGWLTETLSAREFLVAHATLAGWGLAVVAAATLVGRVMRGDLRRTALVALQAVLVAVVWTCRPVWTAWIAP